MKVRGQASYHFPTPSGSLCLVKLRTLSSQGEPNLPRMLPFTQSSASILGAGSLWSAVRQRIQTADFDHQSYFSRYDGFRLRFGNERLLFSQRSHEPDEAGPPYHESRMAVLVDATMYSQQAVGQLDFHQQLDGIEAWLPHMESVAVIGNRRGRERTRTGCFTRPLHGG